MSDTSYDGQLDPCIASVSPVSGKILKTFEPLSSAQIEEKLRRAASAFSSYRRLPFKQRSQLLLRAAEILESEKERLAHLITMEMGKLLTSAREEIAKSASICRYYAENAEQFLADERLDTGAKGSYVHYQPLGPILAVMPWNFPFLLVFRFAAPTLMAGNVCLLKHAPNVPQCALAIEDILCRADFQPGVFQALLIGNDKVDQLLGDDRVSAAAVTGGVEAGRHIAAVGAKKIKKVSLELGGSDPFIVMPSVDLENAVANAVAARIVNNGQSCIAAKRFIVAEPIAAEFERRFVARMQDLKLGDPIDEGTELGPLATVKILNTLERQVNDSIAAGCRLVTGGRRKLGHGNFYAPTVLADIPRNAPAYKEELFGPVACLFRAENIDDAITIANDSRFGLGASVWTKDESERKRFVDEVEAGMVFVNRRVTSDPRVPFGGVKESGYSRESGVAGIREYTNMKSVWIDN